MSWQPELEQLRQLIGYLRDSLNGHDQAVRQHAEQVLLQATPSPNFANYLTYIFCTPHTPPSFGFDQDTYDVVRIAAAVSLKTKIKVAYRTILPSTLEYIKAASINMLGDQSPRVQSSAGTIITEIVQQEGLLQWPELLPRILSLATNGTGSVPIVTQEAAVDALSKICEDNTKLLDKETQGTRPLALIIPALVQCTNSSSAKIRSKALTSINLFISRRPNSLLEGVDAFLQQVFRLASDPSPDVRRVVCKSFTHIAEVAPDKIAPHMENLVNYILMQQHTPDDPELELEAAEFWLCVCDHPLLQTAMAPYLQQIIPVLLKNMVYDEDYAVYLMGEEDDDANEEDREEDLKPQFASSKASKVQGGMKRSQEDSDDDLSDGEIDEDDDEYGDDPEAEWTVRKCSAASLDMFANVYHDPVFQIVLPYLKDNLKNPDWTYREAAVLALGAISNGCMESIVPHLPELVPYLVSLLQDQVSIVRKITCWCLGRYSEWAASLSEEDKPRFYAPIVQGLLQLMLDKNKKVQEAATSGFISLEEKSGPALVPYCKPILIQFVSCFQVYKTRNLYVLYDCIQTLASAVDRELARPDLIEILMPALISRYNALADDAREMIPLLECLGFVIVAYHEAFAPFAPTMYIRALNIIRTHIGNYISYLNRGTEEPEKDYLITSLDLVSSIIQAIGKERACELVANGQPSLFELLRYCLEDPSSEVRISAYALLGDAAVNVFPQLEPFIPSVMPELIKQLDLDQLRLDDEENALSVVNNACWASGEIALNMKEGMLPYLEELFKALVIIMANEDVPDTVVENATVALGRLGIGCAEQLAPQLSNFADMFLRTMEHVFVTSEKGSSFLGFNQIVKMNPMAMETCLQDYIHAIAAFPTKDLPEDEQQTLRQSFYEVVQGYKQLVPNFNAILSNLPPSLAKKFQATYLM
ncbi:hypothetical protein KEM56_000735 [Ascosphaera pollenicola]|nr:hypothetical protein KEM56_000735 [Ascosphaera pollenicola]